MRDPVIPPERVDPLSAALSRLPALNPEEDRLNAVLRALQKPSSSQPMRVAEPSLGATRHDKQLKRWRWAIAASLALLGGFWWQQTTLKPGPERPELVSTNPSSVATEIDPELSNRGLAALIANSQLLEAQLRDIGTRRATFQQLNALKKAELSLATLDSTLAELPVDSPDAKDQQRALWRERVAVLTAVNDGNYRPALYTID